jgi:hypothetical protein
MMDEAIENSPLQEPQADGQDALAAFHFAFQKPIPVPQQSLRLLSDAALGDTGGSQAARNFLFWLAGKPDPTGFEGDGGMELRRLDAQLKSAALDVIAWWAGPTDNDQPLYDVLAKLRGRFGGSIPKSK